MIKTQAIFNWISDNAIQEGDYEDVSGEINQILYQLHNKYTALRILSINQSMNTNQDNSRMHVILYTIVYDTGEWEEDQKTYMNSY